MKLKNLFVHYWKSILVIGCILYLSFTSPSTFKEIPKFENEDKLVHLLMFAGLTSMLIYDLKQQVKYKHKASLASVMICILFSIFLGGAIEILQPMYFAPRTAEWLDWFSDIGGVFLGWLAMYLLKDRFIFKHE